MQNSFRGDYNVLLPLSGDTKGEVHIAAIATDVPYIVFWDTAKSEACNEPLGTFVLKILANPY